MAYNLAMQHRSLLRLCVLLASFGLVAGAVSHAQDNDRRGRKYKAPPPSSTVEVTVLKADNGKPIENAAVIFHPIEGDKDTGSMELKTNEDGKATIDVIPLGDTILLQVIANGFQTYGQQYKIDKLQMSMQVKLNRPVSEYSTYKNNNAGRNSGQGSGQNSGTDKSGDSSSGGKGAGSGSQPQNPPDQSQPKSK